MGKGKRLPPFHRPEEVNGEWVQGLFFSPQSYTPSACILTLHPVILPIPYLVFSHLVELTACILCFIFHSIPCIVVGVWVCLCKYGRMHVCISVPKASVDKRDVFLDALVACAHPPKTLTVELNGLKRSERGIPELHLKALLRSFVYLPDFTGR